MSRGRHQFFTRRTTWRSCDQIKVKEVVIKEQMIVEETKRQIQRDQEETKREMALKLIEAGKDPEETKAFLNALGYM